jgi:hypothetical protein
MKRPTIIQAIEDGNLFRAYLAGTADGDLSSWAAWQAFLKTVYGLRLSSAEHEVVRACTGRDPDRLRQAAGKDGFAECLCLCGRRSGKSKVIALVAAFDAVLGGKDRKLSAGETGLVCVVSPTRNQSRIIFNYLRSIFRSPVLENEVAEERKESFLLANGLEVAVATGTYSAVRGFSVVTAIVDEAAFIGFSEESRVKNDVELVRAIKPSLASTEGRLLVVTSPYAAQGYVFETWRRYFGQDDAEILVWNGASLEMNPTLSPRIVERAVAEDPLAANVEYCTSPGLFREDVEVFVSRATVEPLVVRGRMELPPLPGIVYAAFADVSGGRKDDAALAIGHKSGRVVILDYLGRWKSPHDPYRVCAEMVAQLRRYRCDRCIGDAFAAEWVRQAFASHGINYRRCTTSTWKEASAGQFSGIGFSHGVAKPKSQLYLELLPRLTSGEVELLDHPVLVSQLCSLQRRTRSGSRDSVDHPPGAHDDCANVVAGVADAVVQRRVVVGVNLETSGQGGNRPSAVERELERLSRQREFELQDRQRALERQADQNNQSWRDVAWRAGRCDRYRNGVY